MDLIGAENNTKLWKTSSYRESSGAFYPLAVVRTEILGSGYACFHDHIRVMKVGRQYWSVPQSDTPRKFPPLLYNPGSFSA